MKKIVVFILTFALTLSFIPGILAMAVTVVYTNDFETNSTGWYAPWGGTISLSSDEYYSGSKSLKFSGRTQSWHCPSINFYNQIKDEGPGVYEISVYILVDKVDAACDYTRIILRGEEGTSFMNAYGSNYYCALSPVSTMTENQWQQFTGTFTVESRDIVSNTGLMYLCIDLLAPADGQNIYFDNVTLTQTIAHRDVLAIIPAEMTLDIGETQTLIANYPSGVTYTSSDENVAIVNSEGAVTGISQGMTTITARYGYETSYCTVWVKAIPDGTYFMKNEAMHKYLQAGSTLTPQTFTGENNQRWEITYEGSFKYSIVSVSDNKALTYNYDSDNGTVTGIYQAFYTGEPTQCWKLENPTQSLYKIFSFYNGSSNTNYCIATYFDESSNESLIKISNYDVIIQSYGEWIICPTDKLIVYNYYDEGFLELPHISSSALTSICNSVKNAFNSTYDLIVEQYYIPYTSIADECKLSTFSEINSTTIKGACPHTPCCINTNKAHSDLISNVGSGSVSTVIVLWTGHDLYYDSNTSGLHAPSSTKQNTNTIVMTSHNISFDSTYSIILNDYKIEFMHELSHALSLKDHYCYHEHYIIPGSMPCPNIDCDICSGKYDAVRICLMGKITDYSFSYDMHCNECKSKITNHINKIR